MIRSRRSRLADELVFLGRYRTLEKILLYFIKVESLLGCHMYIYIYTLMIYWWYGNSVFGKDRNIIYRNKAQLVCCWFSVFSIFSFASIGQSELARDKQEPPWADKQGRRVFFLFFTYYYYNWWRTTEPYPLHVHCIGYIYIIWYLYDIYLMYIACKCKQSHVHFVEMYTFTWKLGHLIINYRVLHRDRNSQCSSEMMTTRFEFTACLCNSSPTI